ncbi:hypothetical protein ACIQCR_24615 [Streptomyces sp. NPDC093249]|uniref:hypothetical protein n=1 Tax=unclassified Streptomyces TaxID=2593676 RepID=UPI00381073BE
MRDGDQIRILGSGGAPALITVGRPFAPKEIKEMLGSGEWRLLQDPEPEPGDGGASTGPTPRPSGDATGQSTAGVGEPPPAAPLAPPPGDGGVGKPSKAAPKSEWIDHIVRSRLLSREDAETFTKADLIDLCT